MNGSFIVTILAFVLVLANGGDLYANDDEEIDYYLGKLFDEGTAEDYGLHDMLNYPGQKGKLKNPVDVEDKTGINIKSPSDQSCVSKDNSKLEEGMKQLSLCQKQLQNFENDIKIDKQKIKTLEKKLMSDGSVDMKPFYRRFVQRLWNVLEMKEAQEILKDPDEAMVRHLQVLINLEDITAFQDFLDHGNNIHQVDEFLQESFRLEHVSEDHHGFNINALLDWFYSVRDVGKNVENWLTVLCAGFILLGVWAVYLFIKDIQRELRWMRIIVMMIILMFFICCLWHWRHMHKVAESRRHAQMMKRGFTDIPEECKPGGKGATGSVWEWVKVKAFGAPDVCEKYFEELMIDPSEEITPAMVIAETLAKFFLQPLQHLGSESAKFITNFYQNVPLVYHLPATIFFVVLLIIILFAVCGYGIDFPLWMGGIRPIYRTESADTSDVDRITKEAIAQLQSDREKFMTESRAMLTDIAKAATASQVQAEINPLLMMSSGIMESQLERLIARQFSNVIPRVTETERSGGNLSRNLNSNRQDIDTVSTITSTPLRRQFEIERPPMDDSFIAEDTMDGNERNLTDRDITTRDTVGFNAVPDAVHYRLKGTPRQRQLPPRDSGRAASSSSLNTDTQLRNTRRASSSSSLYSEGYDERGRPRDEDSDASGVRRRTRGHGNNSPSSLSRSSSRSLRQIDDSSSTSSSQARLSRNQSLNVTNIEESSFNKSGVGENFYSEVKSIFDDSANSLDTSVGESFSKRSTSGLNASRSRESDRAEEIELSASGAKFLNTIEKVMTP